MKNPAILPILAFLSISFTTTPVITDAQTPVTSLRAATGSSYGQLPLSFEANQGQADASTQFLSHGMGYTLLLRAGEAVLALHAAAPAAKEGQETSLVSLRLMGANLNARAFSEDKQISRTNYFLGNDPAQWRTDLPNYGRVRYGSIYEGIDLVYYGNQRQLEHDFIVGPDADPAKIVFALTGAKRTRIDSSTGDLVMSVGSGDQSSVRLLKPVAYQESKGRRIAVASSYQLLAHNQIGFALGRYNHARPLIIDPVLVYSTYLGGSGPTANYQGVDRGNGVVVDPDGNAYIVGSTQSADFPVTSGVYQPTNHGVASYPFRNAFISKINATGTQLIFSTYLGSSDNGIENDNNSGDQGVAIAVDSDRNVYIAGYTTSTDFPTTPGAFQTVNYNQLPGGARGPTAFAAKLNASGTQLEYSTLLGGHAPENSALGDKAVALAVDSSKNAYVGGTTSSPDFPVSTGAFQTTTASQTAAFVTKLNLDGTGLVYSTVLGSPAGSTQAEDVYETGLALDGFGDAYITGSTSAHDYPVTAGAFQVTNRAFEIGVENAYLTKLNSSGSALVYSTYLGGSGVPLDCCSYIGDSAQAISVDSSGSAYVAGTAFSYDFPIQGGLMQPWDSNGSGSVFLAKFNPSGTALDYSTRIGGDFSTVTGLAVDSAGEAFVFGLADPLYFPITSDGSLVQKAIPSAPNGIFLNKVNASGSALKYATLFGGTGLDSPAGIAVDEGGDAFLTGSTFSTDFPVTSGVVQSINKGAAKYSAQAFLSKLALAGETNDHFLTQLTLTVSAATVTHGAPITITASTASAANQAATGNVVFSATPSSPMPLPATSVALDSNGVATLTTSTLAAGNYILYATYVGDSAHLSSNSSVQPNGTASFQIVGVPSHISWSWVFGPAVYSDPGNGYAVGAIVTDSAGDPVAGVPVTYSAGSYLKFSPTTATTGADGTALVDVTMLKAGTFSMYARASGIQNPAVFQAVVTPAPLTVTMGRTNRIYGAADPTLPYAVQGLVGSDTVTVTPQTTATLTSPPGTYPISATVSGPLATNYVVTVDAGYLAIFKAPLHVSARNTVAVYGQTPTQPTAYMLTGFVNGDTASVVSGAPVLTSAVTSMSPVGFYPIGVQVGTLASADYYFENYSNGEGSVGVYKAPLTIRPTSFTIRAGDPLPTFTYTITGFVNSDTQGSATSGAPVLTTTAPSTAKPGRYYIIGTTGSLTAQNYYFTSPNAFTNGILTITK